MSHSKYYDKNNLLFTDNYNIIQNFKLKNGIKMYTYFNHKFSISKNNLLKLQVLETYIQNMA